MPIMARWGPKSWEVSSRKVAALNGVAATVELDTENSDDKAGSPATKTKALKLQKLTFDFDLAAVTGSDVRSEYESWTALVGQYATFYLAGQRFGPENVQLTKVDLSGTTLDSYGRILMGRITIDLTEYAEEASSMKPASAETGSAGSAGAGSAGSGRKAAGLATYQEMGIRPSAAGIGASGKDKAAKKPGNAQLTV